MSDNDSSSPERIDPLVSRDASIAGQSGRRNNPTTAALRSVLRSCRLLLPTLSVIGGIALILSHQGQDAIANIAGVALVVGGIWGHA